MLPSFWPLPVVQDTSDYDGDWKCNNFVQLLQRKCADSISACCYVNVEFLQDVKAHLVRKIECILTLGVSDMKGSTTSVGRENLLHHTFANSLAFAAFAVIH